MSKHEISAYCYRIKGLKVPFTTPADIEKHIDNYIDKIEGLTIKLEREYGSGETGGFISVLEEIKILLQKVYATQCESYVISLIDTARERSLNYCERVLQQAIADFLLLSIEMQKAQYINASSAIRYRKIERNEDIAKNLSAVGRLIASGTYDKALSIVEGMKDEEYTFDKLEEMLKRREYDRAAELAKTMEKEHTEHIENMYQNVKSHMTVLAVDDRPEILNSISSALRAHFKVLGAPGGKQALDILARNKVDLFFLDIEMPEMDGFEVCRRIRSMREYKETPIIFLTGNASRHNISTAVKLGINDFIVKPANSFLLLSKARAAVE